MSNKRKIHLNLLRRLDKDPDCTQRELAKEMGVSLGKLNYCLKMLMQKGWVKASNFRSNENKRAYSYLLTPSGVEEKGKLTVRFLKQKMAEYECLQQEIQVLEKEAGEVNGELLKRDSALSNAKKVSK